MPSSGRLHSCMLISSGTLRHRWSGHCAQAVEASLSERSTGRAGPALFGTAPTPRARARVIGRRRRAPVIKAKSSVHVDRPLRLRLDAKGWPKKIKRRQKDKPGKEQRPAAHSHASDQPPERRRARPAGCLCATVHGSSLPRPAGTKRAAGQARRRGRPWALRTRRRGRRPTELAGGARLRACRGLWLASRGWIGGRERDEARGDSEIDDSSVDAVGRAYDRRRAFIFHRARRSGRANGHTRSRPFYSRSFVAGKLKRPPDKKKKVSRIFL
jgi:hypothetical protein